MRRKFLLTFFDINFSIIKQLDLHWIKKRQEKFFFLSPVSFAVIFKTY